MSYASIQYWQAMTTTEAAAVARRDPVIILPLAAVEQHGPHLPLSTDLVIGLGILANAFQRLPEDFPALALPPQAVGASQEHARFPGTLSVTPALLADVVHQHGVALAGCGVRRLVLANSHGGNRATLDAAGLRLRDEQGLLVVKATYTDFPRPDGVELPESEWRHGLHGGALETAMMLHLSPDDVRAGEVQERRSLGADLEGRRWSRRARGRGRLLLAGGRPPSIRRERRRSVGGCGDREDPGRALRRDPGRRHPGRAGVSPGSAGVAVWRAECC